jgi:hypothetical protein
MTPPPAATAAGRRSSAAPRRVSGPAKRSAARPAGSSRVAVQRPPRRVSGPIGGRASAAAAAAVAALPQVAPRPQAPRRRPIAVPPRPVRRDVPAGARLVESLRALPDHRLLDRLIGGRVWIVLIGTLLAGIVTLQLTLLRLNAGISHAVQQTAVLTQRNAVLENEISRLSDPQRVIADATQAGFVFVPQGAPRYLNATAGDAARSLAVMRVPAAGPADDGTGTPVTASDATSTAATLADTAQAASTETTQPSQIAGDSSTGATATGAPTGSAGATGGGATGMEAAGGTASGTTGTAAAAGGAATTPAAG